ncbi:MAG: PHP domain-containing protein [Omnitrophica bacterium]|nr:PHP domain-containing protein [Candidatus Omnitrophota bacterium]
MNQDTQGVCDLHIHSDFSDSDASLESIFRQARQKNLRCIAITDHDTIEGVAKARLYSKIYDIELIEGIELSAQYKDCEVHILGYFIDIDDQSLRTELKQVRELRKERLLWMTRKLNCLGVEVDEKELFCIIKEAIPTRLHLALYLLQKGKVNSLREAFKKYISPGKPAYKVRTKYSAQEAIGLIKKYRGVAILAHPHMIPDQSWIGEFISLGIDGLELTYHNMSQAKRSLYTNMAIESGLLRSGGSDAHGSYKEFIEVGGITIPYDWVQEMKDYLVRVGN